jgi:iron complex outermembrane receptor protein
VPPDSDLTLVTPFVKEGNRKNQYLFLQDGWKLFPNLELTTGIRYDNYSDFGSTVNPRIALVWQMRSDLTSKLLYGKAFRAPAFLELYAINSPVAQGNPNLEPETLDSIEFALSYRATSRLNLETNLFRYRTADAIRYVRESPEKVPLAQNVGNQKGFGFEGEIRWKMTQKSGLLANYAFVKVTNEQQQESGNYPRHSGYLRVDYLLHPHWYLDLSMNWVADRKRVFGDIRPQIADYTTVNLMIRYKDIRGGHQHFAFGLRNLLDTAAYEPSPGPDSSGVVSIPNDLPLAGRNFFVEFRYQF